VAGRRDDLHERFVVDRDGETAATGRDRTTLLL
jgi:hypothetical protein